jgi:subtilisin family serine protease
MRVPSLPGILTVVALFALGLMISSHLHAQTPKLAATAGATTATADTIPGDSPTDDTGTVFTVSGKVDARTSATLETIAPGRLVVVYRGGVVPLNAEALIAGCSGRVVSHLRLFGASAIQVSGDADAAIARLLAQPEVSAVLHDRIVKAHALTAFPLQARATTAAPAPGISVAGVPALPFPRLKAPLVFPAVPVDESGPAVPSSPATYYNSPQGWATLLAGGYGKQVPGGPAVGPWNTTQGAGIRIAVLDSGVDEAHPAIAPNLALNLSEVDQAAMPSACDDGSPRDQSGHGTFTASLAAAATGGMVLGVAPQATILNIKVLQRMPAATGATHQAQCEAGAANGLLSWVLQGIQDAVANHASVISLSLGTLVDVTTGDGAGWQAQMDSVTYAAMQAGAVLVAAAGNDGVDLSKGQYVELPAQARGVLPVVASTNPACAENLAVNATCAPGPVTLASYSNFGGSLNAIAAPGGSYPEGADFSVSGFVRGACSNGLSNTTDGMPAEGHSFGCFGLGHVDYVQATGTSAAAPLVAGAAALLRAAHPGWTAAQVVSAMRSSATIGGSMVEPVLNLPAALALQ